MRARGRSMVMLATSVIVLCLVPGAARASGGGGCGAPVTDAEGTAVTIEQFCFTPTILRTAPGSAVTFENTDPTTHNVLGANGAWGSYDTLRKNREIAFRFSEPGVYPYVCAYHPGMVGVVVVGDGVGGAITTTTKDGPVTQVDAAEAARLAAVPVAANEADAPEPAGSDAPWPAVVGIGVALAALSLVLVRRSRRRSLA